jgi:peptidoglycan/LPS O-acetylase OafA/YrhL
VAATADIAARSQPQPVDTRYRSLDAWRGLAALAVVVYHLLNPWRRSGMSPVWLLGWTGVSVFFVVSGYCVLAAIHRQQNATAGQFLRRRWRRIFPPYWASIAVTVGCALVALPFNRGSSAELHLPAWLWLSIGTLTQTLVGEPSVVNLAYWSLCYEAQFYLVVALVALLSVRRRPLALLLLTVAAAVYRHFPSSCRVEGLFLLHWTAFASGMVAYGWRDARYGRAWSLAMLAVVAVDWGVSPQLRLGASLLAAVLLVGLAPFDEWLVARAPIGLLARVGVFSYSLYLIHVPIGPRVANLLGRAFVDPARWLWLTTPIAVAASLAAAAAFYLLVERRFVNATRRSPTAGAIAR